MVLRSNAYADPLDAKDGGRQKENEKVGGDIRRTWGAGKWGATDGDYASFRGALGRGSFAFIVGLAFTISWLTKSLFLLDGK